MKVFGLALGLAAVALPTMASAQGDPARGKTVFARCMACHQTVAGRNGLGPTMAGVVGRKAGTVPGYNYSAALKKSGLVWSPAALDSYLLKPAAKVPGTKMIFPGLPKPEDRANIIAYLTTLK
ncbi:c-type cytochrome [Sphingomonas jatrophae]|uniref:Cytochrome c n=1 Tax=Sphingomonas jatrophae TaxID=1166337 RepID=A0A1I6KDD8_9SPHN|nr:cytochrome c family protein [Sphingomonas jatrophae]SFR89206.1 cytochrome c [Sphingomonas jatrophae]